MQRARSIPFTPATREEVTHGRATRRTALPSGPQAPFLHRATTLLGGKLRRVARAAKPLSIVLGFVLVGAGLVAFTCAVFPSAALAVYTFFNPPKKYHTYFVVPDITFSAVTGTAGAALVVGGLAVLFSKRRTGR